MPISSGAEEVYSLPEMVVTAEKMPVESKKEPQAVQVVDQKEIESLGAVNATQALELVTVIPTRRVKSISKHFCIEDFIRRGFI